MAGVADSVFRTICARYGSFYPVTEMISAKAMYYHDKKTASLLPAEDECPMIVQIFGHEPEVLSYAAQAVVPYATEININMGCPMPKIAGNGDGCALMGDPARAASLVRAVKDAVALPVSVKFRKGITEDTAADFARVLADAGADKLYVHGRTRVQLYAGRADWGTIAAVKRAVRIPVIGNGDIFSAEDARAMLDETGCDGIMIGRGAMGNPFIFRELDRYFQTGEILPPADTDERIDVCLAHLDLAVEKKGARGILESRKHLAWYLKTIRGAAKIRAALFTATDLGDIRSLIESLR